MTELVTPVAVKYNGNQLDTNKKCLSYDYIVINCKGSPNFELIPDHIKIEEMDYGTKVFQNVVNVLIENERFCTLTFNPRNDVIGADLVQLKLENHILYNYELPKIKEVLDAFTKLIEIKISGISRIDVALDIENSTEYYRQMIKDIVTEKILLGGRPKKQSLYSTQNVSTYGTTQKGKLIHNGLTIGKKSSSRYLRIYNKSLEMSEVKFKHHIFEHWKAHNFTQFENIWRFEYSLNANFIREFQINYNQIFENEFIISIFQSAVNNHFVLKENTGKSELNKERTLFFVDFNLLKNTVKVLQRVKIELLEGIQKSVVSAKRQVKSLYRSYYSTSQKTYFKALSHTINNYNLGEWFEEKRDSYIKEFERTTLKQKPALL